MVYSLFVAYRENLTMAIDGKNNRRDEEKETEGKKKSSRKN